MNRKLLVNLLRKSIEELDMITEGFMEMDEYPTVIVQLAKRKTEDIQSIIDQLAEMRVHTTEAVVKDQSDVQTIHPVSENIDFMPMTQEITDIKTVKLEELEKENEMETVTLVTSEAKEVFFTDVMSEVQNEISEKTEVFEKQEDIQKNIETKVISIADKNTTSAISRNEKLSKADHSISAIIGNKRIYDIKQAISIGDRFRFQRELFNGNGEDMNKTLNYINQLATFDEVSAFLKSKYNWNEENESTEDFYQIVKRKFV